MLDAKILIKTSIFQFSKNYGNPTHETKLKVAVNVRGGPEQSYEKLLVPLKSRLLSRPGRY